MTGKWLPLTIHSLCFRIQTEHLIDGKLFNQAPLFVVCFLLLLAVSFFFGPIYCGKLCPAGAATEYLSRLVPDKFKIDWTKYVEVAPIRYGMLAGFVIIPFFGTVIACVYCNFFLFDLFVNYFIFGYFISLTSSLILTAFVWVVVFGLFTKGGRGFCNFLCPVGAIQILVYFIGCKFPWSYKLKVQRCKCIGCQKCITGKNGCPVEAIGFGEDGKVVINQEMCVGCGICKNRCPVDAISIKQTMPMRKDLHEYFLKDYNMDLKVWNNPEES
jgi:ferredoxin